MIDFSVTSTYVLRNMPEARIKRLRADFDGKKKKKWKIKACQEDGYAVVGTNECSE